MIPPLIYRPPAQLASLPSLALVHADRDPHGLASSVCFCFLDSGMLFASFSILKLMGFALPRRARQAEIHSPRGQGTSLTHPGSRNIERSIASRVACNGSILK